MTTPHPLGSPVNTDVRLDRSPVPFELPSVSIGGSRPTWADGAFHADGSSFRILDYGGSASGWSDALTTLHEESAGQDHFIDVASRRHAIGEVRNHLRGGSVILEVGSSSGYLLKELVAEFPGVCVIGSDCINGALTRAGAMLPTVPLLKFDLVSCPLPDSSVDVVVTLNVLEHIEDDESALKQLFRIIKPGGSLIMEVPAGPELYDSYDRELLHWRRYRMSELEQRLRTSGFAITRRSHLGFSLYPFFWLVKRVSRDTPRPQADRANYVNRAVRWSGWTGFVATLTLAMEAMVRPHLYLPFGIRCVVTCEKPRS